MLMLQFPINIFQKSQDLVEAAWVDFPDIAPATGSNAEAAFRSLVDSSFNDVSRRVASGEILSATPTNGRPWVGVSASQEILPAPAVNLTDSQPSKTKMLNYSWTNDVTHPQ